MAIKGKDCKRCKFDVDGAYCESHDACAGCAHLDDEGHCKCMSVVHGKKCPYYVAKEDT